RHDAVDTSHADRRFEPALDDLIAQVGRYEDAMLNDAAVHIDDVQCAVRAVVQIDGTETLICRGEKLCALIGIARARNTVVLFDEDTLDEIAGRLREDRKSAGRERAEGEGAG